MNIRPKHIEALRSFGYTEREAGFLYVVVIHSGYFTQSHMGQFSGNQPGRTVHAFVKRALDQGHVKESKYQNNASVYQLTYKPMYAAIDREDLRNRREHSFDYIKTKLACLDFILDHRELDYFEGEADKCQYFEDHFKIAPQEMPGRTYKGAIRVPDTIRYFVDKFPMFLDGTHPGEPLSTLTYVDPGTGHLTDFSTHLNAYSRFLKRLPRFAFIFAGPDKTFFPTAEKLFEEAIETPPVKLSSRLSRYFTVRSTWDAKRYGSLNNADLEFLKRARQSLVGEVYEAMYKRWQSGALVEKQLVTELENHSLSRQEVQFRTCLLPRDYSSFGQNSRVTGKPSIGRSSSWFSLRLSTTDRPKELKSAEITSPERKIGAQQKS
jgi:hypothetical protein